ncbi:MAG: hypothetical protein U0795_15280 [Pirellulales bacterium]
MPASSPAESPCRVRLASVSLSTAVGAATALCVSAVLAYAADLTESRPWHAVMRPFGDPHVFWGTALAALPLSGFVGTTLSRPPRRRWMGLAGLLLAGWWTLATHRDTPIVVLNDVAQIVPVAVARLSWIMLWQVPAWAMAGPASWPWTHHGPSDPRRTAPYRTTPAQLSPTWLVFGLVAVVVPWLFASHRADSLRRSVVRLTAQQRTWEAWLLAGRWHDLDPHPSAAQSHHDLTRALSEISLRTQLPLNDQSPVADRMERVIDWARLNQLESAQQLADQLEDELCGPAGASVSDASLCSDLCRLQADLAARRGDWRAAAERSELALQHLLRGSARDGVQPPRALEVLLVEVAADYWRRARHYDRALAVIEFARSIAPGRAEYAVLLGDHYRLGGQAWRATQAYESARGTAPAEAARWTGWTEWTERAQRGLDELARTTPVCLWVTRRP